MALRLHGKICSLCPFMHRNQQANEELVSIHVT